MLDRCLTARLDALPIAPLRSDHMHITVALTPSLLRRPETHAVAVVDVLRASSSLVTMFDRGLQRALIAPTLRDARALLKQHYALLCGEKEAVPLPGFDYGNSPADFAKAPLRGKSAVLWTTNGTRAIAAAADAPFVAVAALVNRRAAGDRLVAAAVRHHCDAAIVCAGVERGTAFCLEDTLAAGAIVEAAMDAESELRLTDEAWAALHLWRWYRGDAMCAFRESAHGRGLLAKGFGRDLRHAARVDVTSTVPLLFDEDGTRTLRLRRSSSSRR